MNLLDMGLLGILVALGLLIWLAYRGWSVLLLAPIAALVAAAFGREPLLACSPALRILQNLDGARPNRVGENLPHG